MRDLKTISTNLSHSTDVIGTLNWKCGEIEEQGLPVAQGIADYIGRGIRENELSTLQVESYKKEIKEMEEYLKQQKEKILEGSAKFLELFGVDKLEGNMVSSITISKGKEPTTKQKFVRDCTAKEMEATLLDSGLAHWETIDVAGTKDKARVNKRKNGTVTIDTQNKKEIK